MCKTPPTRAARTELGRVPGVRACAAGCDTAESPAAGPRAPRHVLCDCGLRPRRPASHGSVADRLAGVGSGDWCAANCSARMAWLVRRVARMAPISEPDGRSGAMLVSVVLSAYNDERWLP